MLSIPWTLSTSQQPQQQIATAPDCNDPQYHDMVGCRSVCLALYGSVCLFLSVCLSVCLSGSVCLSVWLSACLCMSLSVCLFGYIFLCVSVSVCLFVYVSLCVYLSVYVSLSMCLCLSVFLSASVCLCLFLSLRLANSVCLSVLVTACKDNLSQHYDIMYISFMTVLTLLCLLLTMSCPELLVVFAVDGVVSRTGSQLFTSDLVTCVWIWH